jgi:IS5 family transposase
MKQQTLAMAADQGGGFERYRRATKRDVFLALYGQVRT